MITLIPAAASVIALDFIRKESARLCSSLLAPRSSIRYRISAMLTVITRRRLLTTIGAAMAVPRAALGQSGQGKPLSAPTVISNPPRDFGPDAPPTTYFADPDVLTVDPAFDGLIQAN